MDGFAVKIGELYLRSDKPITEEQRQRAVRLVTKRKDDPLLSVDDLEVIVRVAR